MRPEAAWLLVAAALLAAGCSRLTFVKPDADKRSYERTSRDIELQDSPQAIQRQSARTHLARSQQRLAGGDLAAAEAEARRALAIDASSAAAHTLLAVVAGQKGDAGRAGEHYAKAAALAPDDGGVLNNYGAWLCGHGRVAESLPWFERALAAPGYGTPAAALANSGACAGRAGQDARAERELRAAVELEPGNAVALGALAELAYRQGRYMDARAFSERRLATGAVDAAALLLASQIEHKLGDTRAAAGYVRRMREQFPGASPGNVGESTQ